MFHEPVQVPSPSGRGVRSVRWLLTARRHKGKPRLSHCSTGRAWGGTARGQLPGPGRLVGDVARKASSYRPGRGAGVSAPRENAMRALGTPRKGPDTQTINR